MAIKVKKVGEVFHDEIVVTTFKQGSFRVGDFMAILTNLDEAESKDGPQWKVALFIGKGQDARKVDIDLAKFLSAQEYAASQDNPLMLPILDDNKLAQLAIFRDRFFIIEPAPRHDIHIEEAVLRIKRVVYAEDVELTSLKSFVANVEAAIEYQRNGSKREIIQDDVKMMVWARDGGACTRCGATSQLHFDHVIPVVRGGSNLAENIQLLCQACNLRKSDKIAF